MGILFAETPDATQAFEFWDSQTRTITYDTTTGRKSGLASWKCDSTGSNLAAELLTGDIGDVARCSCYVRFTNFPAATQKFMVMQLAGDSIACAVSSGGVLTFIDDAGTETTGSTLSVGQDYLIMMVQDRAASPAVKVFLDTVEDIDIASADDGAGGLNEVVFGMIGTWGASKVNNFQHFYVDDVTDLTDPGDVQVTAKIFDTDSAPNLFDTNVGNNPSNRFENNNERPINESNGWSNISTTSNEEEFQIQDAATGDENIAGKGILGYIAWWWAKRGSGGGTTRFCLGLGPTFGLEFTTTSQFFSGRTNAASYPTAFPQISVDHPSGGSSDSFWYESGAIIVYTAGVSNDNGAVTVMNMFKAAGIL